MARKKLSRATMRDIAFWRRAEKEWLEEYVEVIHYYQTPSTGLGLCHYLVKSKMARDVLERRIEQLRSIKEIHTYWIGHVSSWKMKSPSWKMSRIWRSTACGLIAAMLESRDL